MRDWFNELSARERLLVLVCAVFVGISVIWVLGVQPLLKTAAGLDERVTTKRAELANYQELAAQLQALPAGPQRNAAQQGRGDSIVVIIDRTTRQRQLASYLKRNQPEGDGVRLRFEGAPFDALVSWLGELNDNYGMTTINASFDDAGAGRVNCSLVLQRAAG
ncbi:MAG: type II secretion system protein M [Gammaproteobacteria bacterium]|jgi:general secretion pathway protein M|nr:type II secretion system protein M [Gammaproteobacteria bacterium]